MYEYYKSAGGPATGNPFSWPRLSAFPYAETLRPACMPFVPAMEGSRRQRPPYVVFIHTSNRTIRRSEEHTSELQSLMRISYAVFCLKTKKNITPTATNKTINYQHKNTTK